MECHPDLVKPANHVLCLEKAQDGEFDAFGLRIFCCIRCESITGDHDAFVGIVVFDHGSKAAKNIEANRITRNVKIFAFNKHPMAISGALDLHIYLMWHFKITE